MLIHDGRIRQIGDPGEVGREYLRLNFEHAGPGGDAPTTQADGAQLLDAWLENAAGERVTSLEEGEEIRLRAELEIANEESGIGAGFIIANADGLGMFQFGTPLGGENGQATLKAGERVKVSAKLENPLAPGRYFVHCGVQRNQGGGGSLLYVHNALDFIVFGNQRSRGILSLPHEIEAVIEEPGS
jgi:Wzt C-terminal domain